MQCICVHLYREPYIISGIIKGRLRWLGHVERMPEGPLESQERDGWTKMKMI